MSKIKITAPFGFSVEVEGMTAQEIILIICCLAGVISN